MELYGQNEARPAEPSQSAHPDPSTHANYQYPCAYDPSQYQYQESTPAYDQSCYAYQYPCYYQQQQQAEATSIYPPGVPIPPPSTQQQLQPHYSYYPPQQQQPQGINYAEVATVTVPNVPSHPPAIVQSPFRGRGKRGGRSYKGGGHGHLSGGKRQPRYALPAYAKDQPTGFQGASQIQGGPSQVKLSSAASGNSVSIQPPPRMVRCELCRVECNTPEVLEVHKNGKKHKKNLKAYEEQQKLNKLMGGGHSGHTSNSECKPGVCSQPEVEGYGQLPKEHLPSEIVAGDRQLQPLENVPPHAVIKKDGSITGKQKVEEAAPVEELARGQGRGLKRMLKGGRGGKMMKSSNGSRKPAVPTKPKKMVPLICELCNVTCESVVVFQSHLAGKKHLSNLKDFQDQQAMVGQAALQALYPALQALYPAIQALCQPNTGASTSMDPQQLNLHEILGMLTQQALATIPQHQVVGTGTAATSLPPPSDLEAQDHQGSKPEENNDDKLEEPLRFETSGNVPSTSGAVIAAVSVSNSVVSSDCAAHSGIDGN